MSIILYTANDGTAQFALQEFGGQLWLTQADMAELYQTTKQNISKHIKTILAEQELEEKATVNFQLTVQNENGRKVNRKIAHYSLPMIIAVGYRVRSARGIQFRQWATERLDEYLTKGFAIDDERLKGTGGGTIGKNCSTAFATSAAAKKPYTGKCLIYMPPAKTTTPKAAKAKPFLPPFKTNCTMPPAGKPQLS